MTEELSNKLTESFPKFFNGPFYFEIGDGWYDIIYNLLKKIEEKCNETDTKVNVIQVKEKFGGLRFYYTCDGSYDVYDLVDEAMNLSYKTCEITGGPGSLHVRGSWYKTLCDESAILLDYKKIKPKV